MANITTTTNFNANMALLTFPMSEIPNWHLAYEGDIVLASGELIFEHANTPDTDVNFVKSGSNVNIVGDQQLSAGRWWIRVKFIYPGVGESF